MENHKGVSSGFFEQTHNMLHTEALKPCTFLANRRIWVSALFQQGLDSVCLACLDRIVQLAVKLLVLAHDLRVATTTKT